MELTPETREKIQNIELLVLDVDGVMTDGGIWLGEKEEFKRFNVKDGTGIKYLMRNHIQVAILTGRESVATSRRAEELGIRNCLQGMRKKLPAYLSLLEKLGKEEKAVAYMGDDLMDLPLFDRCGLRIAPADAVREVIEQAHIVTKRAGGYGAVREAAEIILRIQGKWKSLVEGYLGP